MPREQVEARRVVRLLGVESTALRALEQLATLDQARIGFRLEIAAYPSTADVVTALRSQPPSAADRFDLVLAPQRALGRLAEAGVLAGVPALTGPEARAAAHETSGPSEPIPPIDGHRDLFEGWWRKTAWYQGRPYGYPFAARTMSLWMRGDFWDEADADAYFRQHGTTSGPPKTWTDFERMVAFQHRPIDGRFGTVVVGRPDEHLWSLWLQFAIGVGARILDTDMPDEYGAVVVNSPEAVRATELYARLTHLGPPDVHRHDLYGKGDGDAHRITVYRGRRQVGA